ncbi:hypothetical protein GCM10009790_00830 [Georgenia ruanii]
MPPAHGSPGPAVGDLVRDIEQSLGRKAAPFDYAIESIPTQGKRYWDLSPTTLLVSEALLAAAADLRDVLRPRLSALA